MTDRIYRVNMTTLTTSVEPVPQQWAGLGGRGLTSTIVAAEVAPTCHPLGPNNKLVFAPGLLSGTVAANSGRLSAGAKSPLTGTIKEANAGGTAAQLFARCGCKALIIEGLPTDDSWYSLAVTPEGVTITEEKELVGQGNYTVAETLSKRFDGKRGVITIGPAGEMKLRAANISVMDPDGNLRSNGRGGLGAVMGAKRVKFISIDPQGGKVEIAEPEAFKQANRTFAKALVNNPISQTLATYGTNVLVNVINEAGALPTRNFTSGQFAGHNAISGETMHDLIEQRGGVVKHNCHAGCVIQCSQIYNDINKNYKTSGFEYESIWAMGADCCVENLDDIAEADRLMDDIGIDTIETSVAMGVAMEAGVLSFGDGPGVCRMLREEVAKGTPLGRIIGNGAGSVGTAFGVTRVPVVKNQAIPAYDPRTVKGMAITYATTPMGADHTAGYAVATNILNVGGSVDPLSKEGQVELSRNLQIATAAIDSTGMCLFIAFAALDDPNCLPALIDMINARFGIALTGDDVTNLGKSILKTERAFNQAAGFNNADDRLPEFFYTEPLPPHNLVVDFSGEEIDSFWNF
ncbi:aldehyde ferredoxin oxidoreductase family protein [Desulfofustis limnaeus]|jgi:aldehyde:ferredoxin oxidoreductase|uniref:Aldehyde ferredoxin oxidoreductase n=1 Tax=Desulfofustis limnaeus TaxID=2740163 RepID=A0ABM7W8X8_9BACT|nr:aldehyde ferredoxin oxidoreductase C-terminal domain-containing protein [Desulfofustis limnaeus]MDX9895483.1 aldehyde ferredoxin oxidoreductase C-terminal domain-containing protein [Desulfofustis sp.]BDD87437.1 aldehyde ferredoxin oxidoreductase [Desulfofustis limnaeus]